MFKKLLQLLGVILISLVTFPGSGCKKNNIKQSTVLSQKFAVMGGIILEIKFYNNGDKEQKALKDAYLAVSEIDTICNIYNPNSELSKLNINASKKAVICSDILWDILTKSKYYFELSEGAFDISASPLMTLWGFHKKRDSIPSDKELNSAKLVVGLDKVIFNKKEKSIKFSISGMKLDLGGVAKGYAVDQAINAIKKYKINSGIINLAGNAYCFSSPPPKQSYYSIGIRNPFKQNELFTVVNILGSSVSTSGDYERFVIIKGIKYSHIMNPFTGIPVKDISSVTVITPSACDADALSTMITVKGAKFANKIQAIFPNTNILILKPINKIKNTTTMKEMEIIKIGEVW